MIKYRYILIILLFIIGCTAQKEEQDQINNVIVQFYSDINSKHFKEMESLCTGNMRNFINTLKNESDNLVYYKKYSVDEIEVTSDWAVATVTCTDQSGNIITMSWDLIKENNQWKLNNYNTSKATLLQEHKTVETKQMPQNEISTTTQIHENADTEDTLYN